MDGTCKTFISLPFVLYTTKSAPPPNQIKKIKSPLFPMFSSGRNECPCVQINPTRPLEDMKVQCGGDPC
jgi:hypothetical protein